MSCMQNGLAMEARNRLKAPRVYASNTEVMQFGDYVDEKTGVPVTALWGTATGKAPSLNGAI